MNYLLTEKKITRSHLYNDKLFLSMWLLTMVVVIPAGQLLDFTLTFLALILFIYSFIETRKGYVILETKKNQLIVKTPFLKNVTLPVDEIAYITEGKLRGVTIFYIYLKNQKSYRI